MMQKRWRTTCADWKKPHGLSSGRGMSPWLANGWHYRSGKRQAVGDALYNEILHPTAGRLIERCDAVLRLTGESTGPIMMCGSLMNGESQFTITLKRYPSTRDDRCTL